MPRTIRARSHRLNSIEFTIPIRGLSSAAEDTDGDGDAATCYICAEEFCDDDTCCRAMTHLKCCTQTLCCACLAKLTKRCRCDDDCEAVIALCPFCREVSPVSVLDVHLGHTPLCRACKSSVTPVAVAEVPPQLVSVVV